MFYTIYKIVNKIDGKIYIGSHKTKNLDDKYMGSGKYLNHAIERYGIENFEKEILFIFDNSEEMYRKEGELVNEEFLALTNTYNLKVGGFGGFDYLNSTGLNNSTKSNETLKKPGYIHRDRLLVDEEYRIKHSQLSSKKFKEMHKRGKVNYANFLDKKHTEETKKKMSESHKGKYIGDKSSQYGTMWITDGSKNSKIQKDKIIPEGWYKGRKI